MNDIITIRGIVATAPRHLVTGTGLSITSFRLASPSRRWDRATSAWVNGDTNWFTVTAFRTLATNVHESVIKGDRVLVAGRLRIRPWEREDRSGVAVEIDGDAIGHDLAFGRSQWRKVTRHTTDETAGPGEHPTAEELAAANAARAAGAHPEVGLEARVGSGSQVPAGAPSGPVPTDGIPHDPELRDHGLDADDAVSDGVDDWTARVGTDGVVPDGVGPDGGGADASGSSDDGTVDPAEDDWPAPVF